MDFTHFCDRHSGNFSKSCWRQIMFSKEPAFSSSCSLCEGWAVVCISHQGSGCSSVQLGAVPGCQPYPSLPRHLPAAASGCPHQGGGSTVPDVLLSLSRRGEHLTPYFMGVWKLKYLMSTRSDFVNCNEWQPNCASTATEFHRSAGVWNDSSKG